jgi:hypothetical protein
VPRARGRGPQKAGGVNVTTILAALLVALGLATVVRTVLLGVGGGFGLLLGAALIAAGAARLYLARRAA